MKDESFAHRYGIDKYRIYRYTKMEMILCNLVSPTKLNEDDIKFLFEKREEIMERIKKGKEDKRIFSNICDLLKHLTKREVIERDEGYYLDSVSEKNKIKIVRHSRCEDELKAEVTIRNGEMYNEVWIYSGENGNLSESYFYGCQICGIVNDIPNSTHKRSGSVESSDLCTWDNYNCNFCGFNLGRVRGIITD